MKKLLGYLFLFSILVLLVPMVLLKTGFFLVNKPVQSSKLLIEGWLNTNMLKDPPFSFETFDTIFISGIKRENDWNTLLTYKNKYNYYEGKKDRYLLPFNGFIFLKNINEKDLEDTITCVDVIAKGSSVKGKYAHFYLSVKDSIIGQSFVQKEYDTIHFNVKLNKSQLGLLNVFYDNDLLTKTEDINLILKGLIINDKPFLTSNADIVFIPTNFNDKVFRLFDSNAIEMKEYLKSYNNISVPIISIDTAFEGRNKTLAEARAFTRYLKNSHLKLRSLNIYTQDFHSRRTYLAYKKVLDPATRIGIYANLCPDCIPKWKSEFLFNYFRACDEFISWLGTLFA